MRRVTAYRANLFDGFEVQCNVERGAALDVNQSTSKGVGPLARSFHSQSIIAKSGDERAHIDRRALVITFSGDERSSNMPFDVLGYRAGSAFLDHRRAVS